jgi:hypothetical protein
VFLSKIWFFLVALLAAVGLTIAITMPRPAQRQVEAAEHNRLTLACSVIDILLADDAHTRINLASTFALADKLVAALESASNADRLDANRMKQVRDIGENLMKGISGHKPDFAMLVDRRGRVVARIRLDENDFGDVVAGRPLVDDALAGYLRDDLWASNGTLYFVSAAPVVKRDPPVAYAGAVVLGHKVTNELAKTLVSQLDVDIGFFLGSDDVAGSKTLALDHAPMLAALKQLSGGDVAQDCKANRQFELTSGPDLMQGIIARLPGEAMARQAFFTVYIKKPQARGFVGTLDVVRKSDLSKKGLIVVGVGFLLVLALGIGFMWIESDRPLRRLAADAVKLAKNESERLGEDKHGGKYGSIARSVNIHIDKLGRDAKSARTNLDQLLGPAPEGSLGTIDLLAGALPASRPGGTAPAAAPPPSDFKFHDPAPAPARPTPARTPTPVPRAPTPPPAPAATPPRGTPPPIAATTGHNQTQPLSLDDDILGTPPPASPPARAAARPAEKPPDPYFKQVYDQFVAVKKSCNENTAGLTYTKFSEKLVKNRDDLMAKTGCKEVRFTVYVKDGKAALKATPVKDEA